MNVVNAFDIRVEQIEGFAFRARFDKPQFGELALDEPPPLGHDHAPNAARILAAAIGNCLAASLVFSLQRAGVSAHGVTADVHVEIARNERKRLRIGRVHVALHPRIPADAVSAFEQCVSLFEDFCVVTESVRKGILVEVQVEPSTEPELHQQAS
jgi:organic hydroperoxide reductase OsmC/OhrA